MNENQLIEKLGQQHQQEVLDFIAGLDAPPGIKESATLHYRGMLKEITQSIRIGRAVLGISGEDAIKVMEIACGALLKHMQIVRRSLPAMKAASERGG